VRPVIAALISAEMATLHELQTVYSVEDAYDMFEILQVNNHNARVSRSKVK
jgi:precorrin-6B methylase 2